MLVRSQIGRNSLDIFTQNCSWDFHADDNLSIKMNLRKVSRESVNIFRQKRLHYQVTKPSIAVKNTGLFNPSSRVTVGSRGSRQGDSSHEGLIFMMWMTTNCSLYTLGPRTPSRPPGKEENPLPLVIKPRYLHSTLLHISLLKQKEAIFRTCQKWQRNWQMSNWRTGPNWMHRDRKKGTSAYAFWAHITLHAQI